MNLKLINEIRLKVTELNRLIDELDNEFYTSELIKRLNHITRTEQESFLPAKWILKLKTPKAPALQWKNNESRMQIQKLLETDNPDLVQLTAQLNLFTLNAAIILLRLQAKNDEIKKAEELRQLAAKIHASIAGK